MQTNNTVNLDEAHNQWATRPDDQRFEDIDSFVSHLERRRENSYVRKANTSDMAVHFDDDALYLNGETTKAELTNWSGGQLCQRMGAPAAYLRKLPNERAAGLLNYHLKDVEPAPYNVMFYEKPDGNGSFTTQAITTEHYGRIFDADVVNAIVGMNERTGNKFRNPVAYGGGKWGAELKGAGLYASDRDMFMFMIDGGDRLDIGERAKLHRGFFASNSEVGNSSLRLKMFLFNEVCGNNIVWGAQDITELTMRHSKYAPTRFVNEAEPSLLEFINATGNREAEVIKRAMEYKLPAKDDEWWKSLSSGRNAQFTKGEVQSAINMAEIEEGECATLWDLEQGFTAHARMKAHIDARIDLETRAGKLLNIVRDSSTAVLTA